MTQLEEKQSSEDFRKALRGIQFLMRNYALQQFDRIGPRTLVALQNLGLIDDPVEAIGANVDIPVIENSDHPRRVRLSAGPLLAYLTEDEIPKQMIIELPVLLYSGLMSVRKAALRSLDRMVSVGALELSPKTRQIWGQLRGALGSEVPEEWRPAAIEANDAFGNDFLFALQGVRQSLECKPVFQEGLNSFVPHILHPAMSSLDSIVLTVGNPDSEHIRLDEVVQEAVREAKTLREACERFYVKLGYLPLAPQYGMPEVVSRWLSAHPGADVWADVWSWARAKFGPVPRYHACSVFVCHPEMVPADKYSELWREILAGIQASEKEVAATDGGESWLLRRELARHFVYHLEAYLPDQNGGKIACLAWWCSERVAELFPGESETIRFYRKNWIEKAAERSAQIWLAASPHIERSYLRYATSVLPFPWGAGLLALLGANLERLAPDEQPPETQAQFHEAIILQLISALPFPTDAPAAATYSLEYPMSEVALTWALHQPREQRKALEQLVTTSRRLGSIDGLCSALRMIGESSLADQVAVGLALKAKSYTDPQVGAAVWEILSDEQWRHRVLGTIEERVLGLLIEGFTILQVDNQGKWFTLLPHYLADLCEKTEDEGRRRSLFLYVVHASLASDTTSAVRRLLRGRQKVKFIDLAMECRNRAETMWAMYPAWVQGRLRGLLANLHVV